MSYPRKRPIELGQIRNDRGQRRRVESGNSSDGIAPQFSHGGLPGFDLSASALKEMGAELRHNRYGTDGAPVSLRTNIFNCTANTNMPNLVYQYQVSVLLMTEELSRKYVAVRASKDIIVEPDTLTRPLPVQLASKVVAEVERCYKDEINGCKIAYDGSRTAFLAKAAKFKKRRFDGIRYDGAFYMVSFRYVNPVPLDEVKLFLDGAASACSQEVIRVLDIAVRTVSLRNFVCAGKRFAILPDLLCPEFTTRMKGVALSQFKGRDISRGCDAYVTFQQAFRAKENGLILFMDTGISAFYKPQTVLDSTFEMLHTFEDETTSKASACLHRREIDYIRRELIYLRVTDGDGGKEFRILDVTSDGADKITLRNDRSMSIQQTYEDRNIRLRYPGMPCVKVREGKFTMFIPFERAMIVRGQARRLKMTPAMQSRCIEVSKMKPEERMAEISSVYQMVQEATKSFLEEFGIACASQSGTIAGRILLPPSLEVNPGIVDLSLLDNNAFDWLGLWGRQVFRAGNHLKHWGIIVTAEKISDHLFKAGNTPGITSRLQVENFIHSLARICRIIGLGINKPKRISVSSTADLPSVMIKECQEKIKDCQLLLIFKEHQTKRDYHIIKAVGETYLGIPTQCVTFNVASCPKDEYFYRIAVKLNCKMGGITARLPTESFRCMSKLYMIVGVSQAFPHAEFNRGRKIGFTVLAGSMDARATEYAVSYQTRGDSIGYIMNFGDMLEKLIEKFSEKHGFPPMNILFYRNGVSDGQFGQILKEELSDGRSAAQAYGRKIGLQEYYPKMTIVVVQRAGQLLFYPEKTADGDESRSCQPGTVIDRGISDPDRFDFFLVSHTSKTGTPRPNRYTVLFNEIGIGANEIQKLTFDLCFGFSARTEVLNVPAPMSVSGRLAERLAAILCSKFAPRNPLGRNDPMAFNYVTLPPELKKFFANAMGIGERNEHVEMNPKIMDKLFFA